MMWSTRPIAPSPHKPPFAFTTAIVATLLGAFLFGCETAVDPVIETELPFTMFGYFNPTADTQAVRIFPIDGVLVRTADGKLGAAVTSTNLTTGEDRIWSDSVIVFPPLGEVGHVYWSAYTVDYEETHHLSVVRQDGVKSEVTVKVPPQTTSVIMPGDESVFELPIEIQWLNAPNLIDIVVTYKTTAGNYPIKYGVAQSAIPGGRAVVINFRADTRFILLEALAAGVTNVKMSSIELSLLVTNAEWVPPNGRFDADVLVEPGVFSNVENGFGFVGAGYRQTIEWTPADSFLRKAGFTVD